MAEQWAYEHLDHTDTHHVVSDDKGDVVALVPFGEDDESFEQAERRARLIAAAPDLLSVCMELEGHHSPFSDGTKPAVALGGDTLGRLRAAIAKATGKEAARA